MLLLGRPVSRIPVRLPAELGLDLQRAWCVPLRHDELDKLDDLRPSERLVIEQVRELLLRGHAVRLGVLALLGTECLQELCPSPTK